MTQSSEIEPWRFGSSHLRRWLPVAVWMVIIFSFSGQSGTDSGGLSRQVAGVVTEIVVPDFGLKTPQEQAAEIGSVEFGVRKTAHATEYAVLGVLVWWALRGKSRRSGGADAAIAVVFASIYSLSDEFHQSFIPGRSAQWLDCGIDTLGALAGVSAIALLTKRRASNRLGPTHADEERA